MTRLRCHQPTQEYMARRTAQVMSKREIVRCLKRYVARDVYGCLVPVGELAVAA
jgi:transposase